MNREERIRATWEQSKHLWRQDYGPVFRAVYRPTTDELMTQMMKDLRSNSDVLSTRLSDIFTFEEKIMGVVDPDGIQFELRYVICESFVIAGHKRYRDGRITGLPVEDVKKIISDIQLFEAKRKIERENERKRYAKEKAEAVCRTNQSGNIAKRNPYD